MSSGYDARGFGRSTTEDVEFTHRADLVAVMDGLGLDRAALVGNSRGGMLAFDAALESPERVVAVVGVAAGLGGFESESTAEEESGRARNTSESTRPTRSTPPH